ncbi:histidine kinase [Hymenobacter volaticus]|uniref:Histidine kinase n=1 Tax=Hymenobacter volaticus TaxID=2932254 RepID=A0ABY4GE78_9BACT|nr:histidine kinase [Hymenobacter volaticus]UOQ69235.1 histidine kinase [Hymenobacter volaticus]
MSSLRLGWLRAQWGTLLAWLLFYLLVHFNLNDEQFSFWAPMKFVVAFPQTLFSLAAVYGVRWLFPQPLDIPLWKLLLYGLGCFLLLHVVYYYALHAAQPLAPEQSVTHRRWVHFMAGQGPFYFLRNRAYLLTVSPYFFGLLICLPLAVFLLYASRQESQQLAWVQQRHQAHAAAVVRQQLNSTFCRQLLERITQLLAQRQAGLAAEVTLKLAQLVRHTLYAGRQEQVPLSQELDAYLDYVYLQEVRLEPQVEITVRFTATEPTPPTVLTGILLPLTEQWLGLGGRACEIELRVDAAQLMLSLWTDAAPNLLPEAAPAVVARLRQYNMQACLAIERPSFGGVLLTLGLPLVAPLFPPQTAAAPLVAGL